MLFIILIIGIYLPQIEIKSHDIRREQNSAAEKAKFLKVNSLLYEPMHILWIQREVKIIGNQLFYHLELVENV